MSAATLRDIKRIIGWLDPAISADVDGYMDYGNAISICTRRGGVRRGVRVLPSRWPIRRTAVVEIICRLRGWKVPRQRRASRLPRRYQGRFTTARES